MNMRSGKKKLHELMYCQIGIMAPSHVEINRIRLGMSAKAPVVPADRSDIPWISSALKWELFHLVLTLLKPHRMDDKHARAVSHVSGTLQSPGSNSSNSTGIIISDPLNALDSYSFNYGFVLIWCWLYSFSASVAKLLLRVQVVLIVSKV